MKLQLIILGLLVVATFAHRHGDQEGENQYGRRRHSRSRVRSDNLIAGKAEDADLEDSISSEEENVNKEPSQRRGCGGRRGERRGGHRHQFQHNPEYHQRSGVDEGSEHNHQSGHNAEWHEKHGVPMPSGDSNGQWGRHHHKHHHHHHHHRTTTTVAPTTTSSTVPPSAEEFDTATK